MKKCWERCKCMCRIKLIQQVYVMFIAQNLCSINMMEFWGQGYYWHASHLYCHDIISSKKLTAADALLFFLQNINQINLSAYGISQITSGYLKSNIRPKLSWHYVERKSHQEFYSAIQSFFGVHRVLGVIGWRFAEDYISLQIYTLTAAPSLCLLYQT